MREMSKKELEEIEKGDFLNNDEVDEACLKRLLHYCDMCEKEGEIAKELLFRVKKLLDI